MRRIWHLLKWEWTIQLRSHILTIAGVITGLYILVFLSLSVEDPLPLLITLVFTDPGLLAFMFIGVLVLYEKSSGMNLALTVGPIHPWELLLARGVSLSLLGIVCGLIMTIAAYGWVFNYGWLILGIFSSSLVFAGLGFLGVVRVKSFNQYMMVVPTLMTPMLIPLIPFWAEMDAAWMYIIPSHASLVLYRAAFEAVSVMDLLYAVMYLLLWASLLFRLCLRDFRQYYFTSSSN